MMSIKKSAVLFAGLLLALATALPVLAEESASAAPQTVCLQCHGSQPGRLGEPVKLWHDSVHAANGISCHDCHGGDPTDFAMAMSPERGFLGAPEANAIPEFCGRCHIGVKEDYLASKHGQALGKGGPQCVTCHSNHAVQRASLDLINEKSCTRCHTFARAAEIKQALSATDGLIAELESEMAKLHRVGISVKAMQGEVFDLRNNFHRLFHTVDVEQVRKETDTFQTSLGAVKAKIAGINTELGERKMWGGVAVALLVFAGLLFVLIRRSYHEEEDHSGE